MMVLNGYTDNMNVATTPPIPLTGSIKYYNNISYDKYNRTSIDLFVPQSDNPTGCVVHFHGGGFVVGRNDPTQYPQNFRDEIQTFLDAGIAFAYVNYRLMTIDGERENLLKPLKCGIKAINFLADNGIDYNLDKNNFCFQGSSGGNGLIMHNLHYGANSAKCVVLLSPQATYDPFQNILSEEGFDIIKDMNTYVNSKKTYLRGCGVKNISDLYKEEIAAYRERVNYIKIPLKLKMAEAYVETLNEPSPLENNPTLVSHHFKHCIRIHDKFLLNGVKSFLNIPTATAPYTQINEESKIDFIIRNLVGVVERADGVYFYDAENEVSDVFLTGDTFFISDIKETFFGGIDQNAFAMTFNEDLGEETSFFVEENGDIIFEGEDLNVTKNRDGTFTIVLAVNKRYNIFVYSGSATITPIKAN